MGRIGIMGGTFDPIHCGHLIAAETAREACALDEVWFVPSYTPPLKDGEPGADGETRLHMVQLAIADNPFFSALDLELARGGVSYSVDTASTLCERYPEHQFSYIIGSDRINDLERWHRVERLAELVRFIGFERPGEPADRSDLPPYLKARLSLAQMPPIGISSTDIRERRAAGRSIQYLVPDGVLQLIRRKGLYATES
ncbi:nicotinate-nucleotide adenylyltransferase [Paenibacillus sp. GCM10023252]|uniref:nicotinate-nucleotide adenylyltransferase n=1 Tax=Paenibacillus sp. GCM10023252 TaxID=3252649 RepID=UPI0036081A6E